MISGEEEFIDIGLQERDHCPGNRCHTLIGNNAYRLRENGEDVHLLPTGPYCPLSGVLLDM